jgi:hypothetical protein
MAMPQITIGDVSVIWTPIVNDAFEYAKANSGRLWSEIYPHTNLFLDLILSYTGVQREL